MIGELRSACFSPKFQCCLGIAMIDKSEQDTSQPLQVSIEGLQITAQMTPLPFTK
jgi:dimethylsulfoniopropionate demethylase